MNTLTKNRILQKGDEYLDGTDWKLVPKADFGLQIMFTKYSEVRRPSEPPAQSNGETISPDSEKLSQPEPQKATAAAIVTAKAEKEKSTPAPTPSGAGGISPNIILEPKEIPPFVELAKSLEALGLNKSAKTLRSLSGMPPLDKHIPYPETAGKLLDPCQWIGRNGTFNAIALNLHKTVTGKVRIVPQGKRGEARNAMIEFPVEIIPQLIEWLNQHK